MTIYFIETKIPNVDDFLGLDVEAVAQLLLAELVGSDKPISLNHYLYTRFDQAKESGASRLYGDVRRDEVKAAIAEGWGWLTNQGLLAPDPTSDKGNSQIIARKAKGLSTPEAFEAYRLAASVPRDLFHPILQEEVRADLLRGRYDVAVFQAFKEVEVAVCKAAEFHPGEKYSTGLLNAAFGTDNGKLTDRRASEAERKARLNLFSGAMGSYKNPLSHRHLNIETLREAVELVMVASHLLRIVDRIKHDRGMQDILKAAKRLTEVANEAAASMKSGD
ncbi:MAG: TIGR02391 family protein [Pseudomonadota bacterium]